MSENRDEIITEERARPFEKIELFAAVLLGLAAIATAFASFESSLYGGKSVEGYGRANKIATAAAAERSRAVVEMAKDSSVELDAMRLTLEADDAGSPAAEARNYYIATYLFTTQLSDPAYKALGLPPEAKTAQQAAEDSPEDEDKAAALQEQVLENAMERDLATDENYRKEMLAKSQAQFDEADKVFKEGEAANETGDRFQLVAVIYAISLFFGGIVQVFRNDSMRWGILGIGALLFVVATGYMLTVPFMF